MNYRESLDYILRFADYERLPRAGIVWDLKRIERLLERLGNPHLSARTVHVAGTKGKGSTAAMLASILTQAGYKTGFYTSPHLLSYTERIRINGENISEADWAALVDRLRPHVEAENADGAYGQLTTFEIMTAMAFLHFHDTGAAYQVMEVGLGGRLDATNVVPRPEVCVITSVSYDHTDVLGTTLGQIAGEKAGIVKPGVPVVSAPQFPEAMEAIARICAERNAPLIRTGQDVTWQEIDRSLEGQTFRVRGRRGEYHLHIPLLGRHQIENAANAVAAAEILAEKDAKITPEVIARGLAQIKWPGRLQLVSRRPRVVVDCAHNAYSMQKLIAGLRDNFEYDRLILILGFGADKDIDGMIAEAIRSADKIILVKSRHPRAVPVEKLVERFRAKGGEPATAPDVTAGLRSAMQEAGESGLVCAAGSVFVVAEVMEELGAAG